VSETILSRVRRMAEAATPGPWHWKYDQFAWKDSRGIYNEHLEAVAHTTRGWSAGKIEEANAAFIAAIRTDALALVELAEELKRERDEARVQNAQLRGQVRELQEKAAFLSAAPKATVTRWFNLYEIRPGSLEASNSFLTKLDAESHQRLCPSTSYRGTVAVEFKKDNV
jgi:hypothetical protein